MKDNKLVWCLVKEIEKGKGPKAIRSLKYPSELELVANLLIEIAQSIVDYRDNWRTWDVDVRSKALSFQNNSFCKINQFRIKNWNFKEIEYKE